MPKMACTWFKCRKIDQWKGIVIPEIDPQVDDQVISDEVTKKNQQSVDTLFNKWSLS